MQIFDLPRPSIPSSRERQLSNDELGWVLSNLSNILLYPPEVVSRIAALRRHDAPVLVEPRIKNEPLTEQVFAPPKGSSCIQTARVDHRDDLQPFNVLDHHVSNLPIDYLPDSASAKKLFYAIATGLTCCTTLTLQQIINGMALPGPFIPANGVHVDLDQLLPFLLWEAQGNLNQVTDQLNIAQILLPLLLAEEFTVYRRDSGIPNPGKLDGLNEPQIFYNCKIEEACGGPIMILTTEKYSTRDYIDADGEHQLALYLRHLIQQKGFKSAVVIIIQRAKQNLNQGFG